VEGSSTIDDTEDRVSFVRDQLREGEAVVFETRLHKVIFMWPVILSLVPITIWVLGGGENSAVTAFAFSLLGIAAIWFLVVWIRYRTSEFAVTDRRVLIKTGLISRRSMETNLSKIEGINVDQDIPGRLLGHGSIVVRGTGGGSEPFKTIARPLLFRKVVQEQIDRVSAAAHMPPLPGSASRPQRPCPWCAEMILAEARICRFCQRELPATPGQSR
jgi:hypothetical protein